MALGNIECPNCGSTFEYDSEKRIAKCPNCGTQFMVRDVEMKTTVNNFYGTNNNTGDVPSKADNRLGEYEDVCLKLMAYAEHSAEKKVDELCELICNEYPTSYFYEVVNLYNEYDSYYAFLSPDKYLESKKSFLENVKSLDCSTRILLMRSLAADGYKMTENQALVIYKKDKDGKPNQNNKVRTDIEMAECFFNNFIDFVNDLESSSYVKKYMKHEFEKQHFENLQKLREDAKDVVGKLNKLHEDLNSYVNTNKMFLIPYLDELGECLLESEDTTYYTYGLKESKIKTGIICDIIAYATLLFTILLMVITKEPGIAALFLIPYIFMFIGVMRYDDGARRGNWPFFVFLPPVGIILFIIFSIKTFVLVGRSKRTKKIANKKFDVIVKNIDTYKATAKYKTLAEFIEASGIKLSF